MSEEARERHSWIKALAWSALVVAALLGIALVVNLLLGRRIHWDIVSIMGAAGFVVLTLGRRIGYV